MPKIAFIGAGSVVFARRLIGDILSFPELQGSTISLMDIDAGRLELITQLANKMVAQFGWSATIESTLDRCEALAGADYVLIMIQVGGLEAFASDVEIPRKYGIDQTVGDTIGPGGVFRGLRTIPVLLDICWDMEELCPDALLINYSNPMAMNCWGMDEGSEIATVGLCHSVQGTAAQLARYIGAPEDEVSYWVAGINHMSWFLEYCWGKKDAYPMLWEAMEKPEVYAKDRVRFEIMKRTGYFVTESSHHMSEYVPYFRQRPELIERFVTPRWDYLEICRTGWQPHYDRIRRQIAGEEPLQIERTHEYAAQIIHAMETNIPTRINGNVRNDRLISNLPEGCCVEVPCLVDRMGIHPCRVGDLPSVCAALNRSNINVQELAVQAALLGDRELVLQAVMMDPLTASILNLEEIEAMVAEMFAAEAAYLPQFG